MVFLAIRLFNVCGNRYVASTHPFFRRASAVKSKFLQRKNRKYLIKNFWNDQEELKPSLNSFSSKSIITGEIHFNEHKHIYCKCLPLPLRKQLLISWGKLTQIHRLHTKPLDFYIDRFFIINNC